MKKETIITQMTEKTTPTIKTISPRAIATEPKNARIIKIIRYGIKYFKDSKTDVKIFLLLSRGFQSI